MHMTPNDPTRPPIAEQVAEHAAELDAIWPGWRKGVPFNHVPEPYLMRIKWLLKRHSLLTRVDGGFPAPADVPVLIHSTPRGDGRFQISPEPIFDWSEETPARGWTGPPKVAAALIAADPIALAEKFATPLEVVEEILKTCPPEQSKAAWVETKIREAKERDAARQRRRAEVPPAAPGSVPAPVAAKPAAE